MITGKDKGKQGQVLQVVRDQRVPRVFVSGINLVRYTHTQPPAGGGQSSCTVVLVLRQNSPNKHKHPTIVCIVCASHAVNACRLAGCCMKCNNLGRLLALAAPTCLSANGLGYHICFCAHGALQRLRTQPTVTIGGIETPGFKVRMEVRRLAMGVCHC